jgi:hypothetical protein
LGPRAKFNKARTTKLFRTFIKTPPRRFHFDEGSKLAGCLPARHVTCRPISDTFAVQVLTTTTDIGLSGSLECGSNYYLVMPTNIYQWIELAACLVIVYIVFRPLVNFLDKIFES